MSFANFRDVAQGPLSGRVKAGVLFRSDAPRDGAAPPNVAWPPATVVDLREHGELAGYHPLHAVSVVHPMPLFQYAAPGPKRDVIDGDILVPIYETMIEPAAARVLSAIVSLVAEGEGSCLVHCAAGKDRTGIVIAYLLRLIGIPHEGVLADYELTRASRAALFRRFAHLYGYEPGAAVPDSIPPDVLPVSGNALSLVMKRWDAHADGVGGFFLAHGGERASIERLRARLGG